MRIEFYQYRTDSLIAALDSDAAPRTGETVNIRNRDYRVVGVSWCVDFADDPVLQKCRANVDLEPTKP